MRRRTVKSTDILKVIAVLITLGWMLFIFYLSSETADESTALSNRIAEAIYRIMIPDFEELDPAKRMLYLEAAAAPVRKSAHFLEFTILGALLCWNLILWTKLNRKVILCSAVAVGAAYAASDEFHQLFVHERSGQLSDVLIDTAGVVIGVILVILLCSRKKGRKQNRSPGKG